MKRLVEYKIIVEEDLEQLISRINNLIRNYDFDIIGSPFTDGKKFYQAVGKYES